MPRPCSNNNMKEASTPYGPGQGALIVRPSGVEVPMGSLLSVIAVTVAANAPAAISSAVGSSAAFSSVLGGMRNISVLLQCPVAALHGCAPLRGISHSELKRR